LCSIRTATIFATISFESECGWFFGRELRVWMMHLPSWGARFTHFTMQPWEKPKCRATFLVDQPLRTRSTAFIRTSGRFSFVVYDILIV
jgi:hypothetical protein